MARSLVLILWLSLPFAQAASPTIALADSILCPNGVVSTGDHQTEVLNKCGEPQYRKSFNSGTAGAGPGWYEEQWGYFINKQRVFIFVNGFLRDIVY